ncbi:MAG: hypothetical protein R3F35_07925 [Myxococcota bacterium]
MVDPTGQASESSLVDPSLVTYTHVIYALHSLSILIGLTSAVTIIGAFLFGVPSILGVILNYVRRPDVRGTFLETHFRWQIRTFWLAFAWAAGGALLAITVILLPLAFAIWGLLTLWVGYRVLRGWLNLRDRRAMPV